MKWRVRTVPHSLSAAKSRGIEMRGAGEDEYQHLEAAPVKYNRKLRSDHIECLYLVRGLLHRKSPYYLGKRMTA